MSEIDRAREVQQCSQQRRVHGNDAQDGAALVSCIDIGPVSYGCSTQAERIALRTRNGT